MTPVGEEAGDAPPMRASENSALADLELDMPTVERILVAFLREECRTSGFHRGILGLSGGLDSAVVCALASRALGPENVTGVMMPASSSSGASLEDAKRVAQKFGIETRRVEISAMAEGYLAPRPSVDRSRRGNIYARCRMIVLYDLSAELGALVLGTSNKTELLLGYGTLHGDLASAINPIGDLYKTQVRAMARHLEIPTEVIEKPPSADLWPGQRDEEDLGATYEIIDRLLVRLVDLRTPPKRLVEAGFEAAFVRSIESRIRQNQFKRRTPIIAKILARTIGPDFRLPRDSGLSLDRNSEAISPSGRSS